MLCCCCLGYDAWRFVLGELEYPQPLTMQPASIPLRTHETVWICRLWSTDFPWHYCFSPKHRLAVWVAFMTNHILNPICRTTTPRNPGDLRLCAFMKSGMLRCVLIWKKLLCVINQQQGCHHATHTVHMIAEWVDLNLRGFLRNQCCLLVPYASWVFGTNGFLMHNISYG